MRLSVVTSFLAALSLPLGVSARVNFPLAVEKSESSASAAAAVTPPKKDPFYSAPKGYKNAKPGEVLRHRDVPSKLRVGPALETNFYSKAVQLLFRTTNGLGEPSVAAQTVIVPKKPNYKQLLSYQTFYDSADINCSPSYTLQNGQNDLNIEGVIISSALRQGWVVTVGDYEGTDAAFTVGRQAGHATLDGIRATLRSRKLTKLAKNPRVALFGYSGGALASEWAVELQPSYAPNLKIEGAAFGGLTPNITSVVLTVNKTPNSGLISAGINGFGNQYQNVSNYLRKNLKPAKAKDFYISKRSCDYSSLNNKNILNYFKNGAASLDAPIFKTSTQRNGIMGLTNTPKIPLFVYKSEGDEVSVIKDSDKLIAKYCDDGANIQYLRNEFGTHETEFIVSLPAAYTWIKDRLDGKPVDKGCSRRTRNLSKLRPSAKKILGNTVYQELKAELQQMTKGN